MTVEPARGVHKTGSTPLRRYLSVPKHEDLVELARMIESGSLMPAVDRIYPPAEVPAALAYIETGHVRGKVAVSWQ